MPRRPTFPPCAATRCAPRSLATMQDPAFVAEAAKTQMDVSPMAGAEVEAFIAGLSVASPAVIERVKQAYMP